MEPTRPVEELLAELNGGHPEAFARLVDAVYLDLKRIASGRLARAFDQPPEALTLTPTALVADAVMELRRQRVKWRNPEHFFAIATRLMLRLIQRYRRDRAAMKRGGGRRGISLEPGADVAAPMKPVDDVAAILEALRTLHKDHPRVAEVMTLRAICHHSLPEVARMLNVSLATVERDWKFARAWISSRIATQD